MGNSELLPGSLQAVGGITESPRDASGQGQHHEGEGPVVHVFDSAGLAVFVGATQP